MDRVEDDVAFGLENRGWPSEAMHRRVPEALAVVGLDGLGRARSRTLSGGQQQRLALGGVLAARPGILVLDEPTANLDPVGADAFMRWLADLRAERSTTIVLIEHRVEAAWPLADLVLALGPDGRPIDVGPPAEVLARSAARMRDAGIWLPGGRRPGGAGHPGVLRYGGRRPGPDGHGPHLWLRPTLAGAVRRLAAGRRRRTDRAGRAQREWEVDVRAPARRPPATGPRARSNCWATTHRGWPLGNSPAARRTSSRSRSDSSWQSASSMR